ncbi:MAG: 4-hydroxy-tetrahydrodipicolinate synthase [Rhodospirillaceae bacterium]|nr:4-hydroxy-tetrahydrodipicolinate synthase [Rhodospirillaceae bacterium]
MIPLAADFLRGSYTPLITPFRDGAVDIAAYAKFVDWQIAQGTNGIVVAGTSGEPTALTVAERCQLLEAALGAAHKRVPVIAATGAASHADTAQLTEHATKAGADAILVLTPMFAKPPQRALKAYFLDIARRTDKPILLYQISSRTNATLTLETCVEIMAAAPHVIGMKQSDPNRPFVRDALKKFGPAFRIFMGLSEIAWDMVGEGACGLIVALANIVPKIISEITQHAKAGRVNDAIAAYAGIDALNTAAFLETNPLPLKYLARRMGLIPTLEYRLPLMAPTSELAAQLDSALLAAGLISG